MAATQESRDWSDLQPELLELVLQRLVWRDYLKCRRVCRLWRSKVNNAIKIKCPPVPQFPSLLLLPPHAPQSHKKDSKLLDITRNKLQPVPTHHAWKRYFFDAVQSQGGWLIYQINRDSSGLFWIFNPVSREKYKLPLLQWQWNPDHCDNRDFMGGPRMRVALSSTPDSQNLLVVICALDTHEDESIPQLCFCWVNDKSWTPIKTNETSCFQDIMLLGWKLYAVNTDSSVTVFNLRDRKSITAERRLVIKLPKFGDVGTRECKLVRDSTCGEVLLVLYTTKIEKYIHIFKLDKSGSRWIEVDNLSGRALFIDDEGVQMISTANLNAPPKFSRDNCVFFYHYAYGDHDLGVFSLNEKKIQLLDVDLSKIDGPKLWFTPGPW